MYFLPQPHEITPAEGIFHVRWDTPIVLQNTEPGALLWARMLQEEIRKASGLDLRILRGDAPAGSFLLVQTADLPADHYELRITPEQALILGGSDEALLHGVTTLMQWVQRHGAILPCLSVRDWPDLPHRGFYLDVSRGRIPTLASLKQTVDLLCRYKINEFQLYIEHTYLFRNLSEAWRDDDPLEAEEILELDAYCRERHIELVPSLATFGHMYQILSTKSFSELCELRDSDKVPFSYSYAIRRHTMNPTHPGALELVKGMIREYGALFTSRKFNICCDETFDLCLDRSAEAAKKEGEHGPQKLYVRYLGELCQWLLDQGITPVYWGDILAKLPESYAYLPKGGICLNWGYEADYPEDEIRALAGMGAVQYACPGLSTWSHLIPMLRDSFSNIRCMCRYAHKYGAIGLLNTDWGDFGHICPPAFSVPGILYGAAFSWNKEEFSQEELNEAVSFLAYGDRSGDFMRALTDLSGNESFQWSWMIQWVEADGEARKKVLADHLSRILEGNEANRKLDTALLALDQAAPLLSSDQRSVLQTLQVTAAGVRLFNEIGLYLAARDAGARSDSADPRKLAERLEKWYHAFLQLWRQTSRQSTLERTRRVLDALADDMRTRA